MEKGEYRYMSEISQMVRLLRLLPSCLPPPMGGKCSLTEAADMSLRCSFSEKCKTLSLERSN